MSTSKRRRDQRVIVNSELVHPNATHGTATGYRDYHCRCEPCRRAGRAAGVRSRELRIAERIEVNGALVHPYAPHGTKNGYNYYGCHCPDCREVNAIQRGLDRAAARNAA